MSVVENVSTKLRGHITTMANLKMYIAVLDDVPDFIVPTLVAHSVLNANMKFSDERFISSRFAQLGDDMEPIYPMYKEWLRESFKKCVIRVSRSEFDKIAALPDVHIGHENKTLDAQPSCIVVCPRYENPNVLKFAKLWKPKHDLPKTQ